MIPKTDAAKYAAAHNNTTLLPNGKIRFDETGMEFPSTVTSTVLDAYATGKAFRRAVARRTNEAYDFSVHEPYIVPHRVRDERHFLYCTLTKATLPRDSSIVQNHVSAKRFRRRLAESEEAKRKREELAEKRREKRERAKASRSSREEQEREEGGDRMDEDNDILDAIISDDDDGDDGGDNEKESAIEHSVESSEGKTGEVEEHGDAMDEDTTEERDIFWTRGRKKAVLGEEEDDDPGESPITEQSTRRKKKIVRELVEKTVETGSTVTGKRDRVNVQVPKKVRRARQRRKAMKQT